MTLPVTESHTKEAMGPMVPQLYKIHERKMETQNVVTIKVLPRNHSSDSPSGAGDLSYEPGQFNMLYSFGLGEVPISISGSKEEDLGKAFTHTIKSVGPVTQKLCSLSEGETIGLRGPFGTPWPSIRQLRRDMQDKSGENGLWDILLMAGGVGLAPLRPLIYELVSCRDQFSQINLFYGARTPQDILFKRDLDIWRDQFGVNVSLTVDFSTPDWRGSIGHIGQLLPRLPLISERTAAMVCGPEVMMRNMVRQILNRGIPGNRIFLSLERNMKCAIGQCGHCQFGPHFLCKDGPVFTWDRIQHLILVPEV